MVHILTFKENVDSMNLRIVLLAMSLLVSLPAISGKMATPVSIYELLANPTEFSGKLVMVEGFLGTTDRIRAALFPNEQAAIMAGSSNRIAMGKIKGAHEVLEKCGWRYANVVGVFIFEPETRFRRFKSIRSVTGFGTFDESTGKLEILSCYSSDD